MRSIFLTGEKHVGKSTLISKVLASLDLAPGSLAGLRSLSVLSGQRDVYLVHSSETKVSETSVLAGSCKASHMIESRPEAFDEYGAWCLANPPFASLILIDEIGNMERDARVYAKAVISAMQKPDALVLGVIQQRASGELADYIRSHAKLVNVTLENRDSLLESLVRLVKESL